MNKIRNHALALVGLIALGTMLSGCGMKWVHPDFEARSAQISRVAVVPMEIDVYKLTFGGEHEPMPEEIAQLTENSIETLEQTFSDKGYEIKKLDLSDAALLADPELRDAYHKLKGQYSQALKDISKRTKKKFEYKVGPEINILADEADTDALVFVAIDAFKKTGGQIAKDMAKTVLIGVLTGSVMIHNTSAANMLVGMIDGNNGDILWLNNNATEQAVNVSNQEKSSKVLSRVVKKYPRRQTGISPEDIGTAVAGAVDPAAESAAVASAGPVLAP
ncbi:MAG: hypothetical protein JW937_01330 [Candidatus Omnitrophica bacterium]|nr:hypothetical protein [Candidatus Omnitrophota bacterium]